MVKQKKLITAFLFVFVLGTCFFISGIKLENVYAAGVEVLKYDLSQEPNTCVDLSGNGNNGNVITGTNTTYNIFRMPIYAGLTDSNQFCRFFNPNGVAANNPRYVSIDPLLVAKPVATEISGKMSFDTWIWMDPGVWDHGTTLLGSYNDKIRIWIQKTDGNKYYINFNRTPSGSWSSNQKNIDYGVWTHIVVTYDYDSTTLNTKPRYSINGGTLTTFENSGTALSAAADSLTGDTLALGNRRNTSTGNWDRCYQGRMGITRLYNGVLDQSVINDHYAAERLIYPNQREIRIYKSNGTTEPNYITEKNTIPTNISKIEVDMRAPLYVTSTYASSTTTYDKINASTINTDNIQLVNADTGLPVTYTGSYSSTTGKYTMTGFGALSSNTNYKVVIKGDNITLTSGGTAALAGLQETHFKTYSTTPTLKILNQSGIEITSAADLANATQVQGFISMANSSGTAAQSGMAVLGVYQGNMLLNVITARPSVSSIPAETGIEFNTGLINLPSGQKTVKLMLWDGMQQLKPLASSIGF